MSGLADLGATAASLFEVYGLLAILLVMLIKEIGVPVPIPKDVIMLTVAAQAASGRFLLWQAFVALLVVQVIGSLVQFGLLRRLGRPFLARYGRYLGLTETRLTRATDVVRRGGIGAISLSLVTPGVRVATIPACALAGLSYGLFVPGLVLGVAAFLSLHFVIGYAGGPIVGAILQVARVPAVVLVPAILIIGLVGWLALRRVALRRQASAGAPPALAAWADACCPACLALGAAHYLRPGRATLAQSG